jgi:hypothetical protein
LFRGESLARVRTAAEEVSWLLGRGYPAAAAIAAVGGHHQLETRQRVALSRGCCSVAQRLDRNARALTPDDVRGAALSIDGFNLIVTLESAVDGGVVIVGQDGALRDLAGVRGTWHPVVATDTVLEHVGALFTALDVASTHWYLDAPVSNSGRLRARIREHAERWTAPAVIDLVADPDAVLVDMDYVATADAAILSRCVRWANIAAWVIQRYVPDAWRVELP